MVRCCSCARRRRSSVNGLARGGFDERWEVREVRGPIRPVAVEGDTLGRLLAVVVTAASVSDNAIGADLLDQATTTYPTLVKRHGADAGFKATLVEHGAILGIDVEVVTKNPHRQRLQRHQTPPSSSSARMSSQSWNSAMSSLLLRSNASQFRRQRSLLAQRRRCRRMASTLPTNSRARRTGTPRHDD